MDHTELSAISETADRASITTNGGTRLWDVPNRMYRQSPAVAGH
jgi:hypothetical protein